MHGEPWTAQFARRTTPEAVWASPLFLGANRAVTLAWGGCFLACDLVALLAAGPLVRILVPLDGSPLAETAMEPAAQLIAALAAPAHCELHLLRVVDLPPAYGRARTLPRARRSS